MTTWLVIGLIVAIVSFIIERKDAKRLFYAPGAAIVFCLSIVFWPITIGYILLKRYLKKTVNNILG